MGACKEESLSYCRSHCGKAREAADELAANGDYDLIFVDLPGTVESTGVFRTIVNMDYVLTPTTPDLIIMQSTLAFPLRYSIMSETRRMCRSRISSSLEQAEKAY